MVPLSVNYFNLTLPLLLIASSPGGAQGVKPKVVAPLAPTYAKDIKPILQARCVVCHNQTTLSNLAASGGLALDSFAAVRKGVILKAGTRAIYTSGKSEESELIKRLVVSSPSKLMPKGGPPLPPEQIALFRKWVEAGAPAGNVGKELGVTTASTLPMPANPGALEVSLNTLVKPTPDLFKKETPKDAALAFALKVGPLPPTTSLAYSPDGKRLVVGGYRSVVLWDTTTGQPIASLTGLSGSVQALAFRPDGTQLAVSGGTPGASGEVRVYDAKTLAPVGATLSGHSDVIYSVAWNATGTQLATASHDKTARLWEWPSGKELQVFRDHSDAVTRVCFAPDGKSVYTASQDHNLRRFDVANGQVIRTFTGHEQGINALALSPDGKGLVSSGPEPRLRWWNPDDGNTTRYGDGHGKAVNEIVFSKDGKFLASVSADYTVRLWDAGSAGQQRALEGSGDWLYTVAISPDGKFTAGAGAEGVVRIWETANGKLRLSLLAWPPVGKASTPDWAVLTPEGYYDASPAWLPRLHLFFANQPIQAPHLATFIQTLRQPENVVKSWQGAPLETAKLPEKPVPPKTVPKPSGGVPPKPK